MKKVIFLFISLLCLSAMASANTLSAIETYDSGVDPRGIAIADINGNGINEVLAANFGAGTLIGQDTSTVPTSSISIFSKWVRTQASAGRSPRGLAAGFINDDAIMDFVVSNYDDGNIMIFNGSASGPVLSDTIPAGKHPVGVAIGRVDGAGTTANCIAVAVYSDSKVVLIAREPLKNTFMKLETVVPGNPTDVAIGKISGENVVVSANYTTGNVSILKVQGGALVKTSDIKTGGGSCKVKIADVNNDGQNEIIVSNFFDNTISVIGFINGTPLDAVTYKLQGERPNGIAVGDVNGDGLNDVVVANRDSNSIDVLLQKDGKLVLSKTYVATNDTDKTFGPVEVAIGDVNGDGMNDIVFTHMKTGTVKVITQQKVASPVVTSSTHSNQDQWYANSSAEFTLTSADDMTGIAGYYYTVSKDKSVFDVKTAEYTQGSTIKKDGLETGTYYIMAAAKDNGGNVSGVTTFKLNINGDLSEKTVYNYPNPATDSTTIRFPLPAPQEVKIAISDSAGKLVWERQLSQGDTIAGVNNVVWKIINEAGMTVSNGVYLVKVITKDKVITKKIVVLK
jgi:hypothetical protein